MEPSETKNQLPSLRKALDEIDQQLVELAARRQQIVSDIGAIKANQGRQLRDFRREREVLDAVRLRAEALDLDPQLAEDLIARLIEASLTKQEQEQVRRAHRGEGLRALVIGGAGRLGQWLVAFLDAQGYDVTVADPVFSSDQVMTVTGASQCVPNWETVGLAFDVVVLATPPGITEDLLCELMSQTTHALIFDVASIKSPIQASLRQAAEYGLKICSIHPMFGPSTTLLSGRHVLLMDLGCPRAVQEAKDLFAETMAQTVEIPLEAHDRLMALVLGLSHLVNLTFVVALMETGIPADELAKLSSTTFERQLEITRDVVAESPHLYFEIQKLNTEGHIAHDALSRAVELLRSAVAADESTKFVELMVRGQAYLQSLSKK